MILYLLQGFSDSLSEKLLSPTPNLDESWLIRSVKAYTSAVERVLGAAPGSLRIINITDLKVWFDQYLRTPELSSETLMVGQPIQRQEYPKEEDRL